MASIYFIEPYTKTKISYDKVHNSNEFRWKDREFPLDICYEGPRPYDVLLTVGGEDHSFEFKWEDGVDEDTKELYEMYEDFKFLLENYD